MAVKAARAWQITTGTPRLLHQATCKYREHNGALCSCEVLLKHPQHLDTSRKLHGVVG